MGLIKIIAGRLLKRAEEAKTGGGMRTGHARANVDAGDLSSLCRWALSQTPPEDGRPTYGEIVEALREIVEVGWPELVADVEMRFGVSPLQMSLRGSGVARALLSRIPEEEG